VRFLDADELVRLPRWPWYTNLADHPDLTEEEYQAFKAEEAAKMHALIEAELAETDRKELVVFVHGFNNSFDYAACTLAEAWHFMGRSGAAVLYSWPAARAGVFGYDPDRESSEFTVSHFKQFLRIVASCDAVERVHVIAHSRGTDVVGTALRELQIHYGAMGMDASDPLKIGNAVLAAADIDREVSSTRLGGEEAWRAADRVTIYTGAGDRALKISARMFKSESRIGQMGPEQLADYNRYTSELFAHRIHAIHRPRRTGFFGHSYFLHDPAVSSDLLLLLRDDRPPGAEHGRPLLHDPRGMWVIEDGYPHVSPEPE
jgi:esterase/lipase superfamily enzyme